jgi:hypothetical protein
MADIDIQASPLFLPVHKKGYCSGIQNPEFSGAAGSFEI